MTQKVRIKDIAEKAGVSVGTVDRILHHRPNVSKSAREKVEKVLKEIHYRPNMYASALAYNRSYTFHLIIPWHEQEAYWEEIEEGAMKACDMRRAQRTGNHPAFHGHITREEDSLYPARLLPSRTRPTDLLWSGLFRQRLFCSQDADADRQQGAGDHAHAPDQPRQVVKQTTGKP